MPALLRLEAVQITCGNIRSSNLSGTVLKSVTHSRTMDDDVGTGRTHV